MNGHTAELAGASAELRGLKVQWLLVAVAVEVLSLVAFAEMDRRLLRCGGIRAGIGRLTAISFAAGAIASSLPGGPVVSSAFGYRQFRRLGASEALAAWLLAATLVFSALGLTLLATAGVVISARAGAAFDLVGVILAVLGIAVVAAVVLWQRRALARAAIVLLRATRRVTGYPRRPGEDLVASIGAHLGSVRLGRRDLLDVVAWSVANWSLDCACLVCGFLAVGAGVPWRGLLLAYGAGQLAANLPITPGGLGVVEGSLVIALVAFGGGKVSTVAAVLLYRIVSFWGYLPVGWMVWSGLTWSNRRSDRASAEADVGEKKTAGAPA